MAAQSVEKPNVLFILVDDLGKEWISCYGAEGIETPHIDALAAGGMKFTKACAMPQCTPSRVTLLTATYPWRNGFVDHWDTPRWGVGYFASRVIGDPRYKVWVSTDKEITQLYDLIEDPLEQANLIASE